MSSRPFVTCLWFDTAAEDAAKFYTAIFKDGKIGKIQRYGKEGYEFHRRPEGAVMTVEFEMNGQHFMALNGGPNFKFNESISLIVTCDTQDEIDDYWEKLTADGGQESQCGWLKDRFGFSWQVVPAVFHEYMNSPDKAGASRVMVAMFKMKKFDIAKLQTAFKG